MPSVTAWERLSESSDIFLYFTLHFKLDAWNLKSANFDNMSAAVALCFIGRWGNVNLQIVSLFLFFFQLTWGTHTEQLSVYRIYNLMKQKIISAEYMESNQDVTLRLRFICAKRPECRGHGNVSAECNWHCFVPSLWTRRHGEQTAGGLQKWHPLFQPEVTRSMRVHLGVCYWKCGNKYEYFILFDLILSKWRGR